MKKQDPPPKILNFMLNQELNFLEERTLIYRRINRLISGPSVSLKELERLR